MEFLDILKNIFGSEIAAFCLGACGGYLFAVKFILPQRIKDLSAETFSRNCPLVECAYGGYKNEVKVTVRGEKVIHCACPYFDYTERCCRKTHESCPLMIF
jgi:hypothetical protein